MGLTATAGEKRGDNKMSIWKGSRHSIICDSDVKAAFDGSLIVIDAGAAGGMFEPFDIASDIMEVYTFEPRDGSVADRVEKTINIPGGIWSESTEVDLHVAAEPTTSSVYPPNKKLLERFPDKIGWKARATESITQIPVISVDDAVANKLCPLPNFIKLDVHSAEYEALKGSVNSMSECIGLLVETWHVPVHAGQYLNGDVERLLNEYGFYQFYNHQNSAWRYSLTRKTFQSDRKHVVGSETLYFRDEVPPHLMLKYIALLELFGYGALAILKYKEFESYGYIERSDYLLNSLQTNLKRRERNYWLKHPFKSSYQWLYDCKQLLLART